MHHGLSYDGRTRLTRYEVHVVMQTARIANFDDNRRWKFARHIMSNRPDSDYSIGLRWAKLKKKT